MKNKLSMLIFTFSLLLTQSFMTVNYLCAFSKQKTVKVIITVGTNSDSLVDNIDILALLTHIASAVGDCKQKHGRRMWA
jgi:hypothetical protein